jgi:hypothetical protein
MKRSAQANLRTDTVRRQQENTGDIMSRLSITLDEAATARYLELASRWSEGEVNEDCEPTGPTVFVDISPVFESEAYMTDGKTSIELGTASVRLLKDQ